MNMTQAQFEATTEFKAYEVAYANWQAGTGTLAAVHYAYAILDNMVRKAMRNAK